MSTRSQGRRRHLLTFGLSLAISAVVLYFVFQRVDSRLLRQLLQTQSHSLLIAAAAFILLQIILGGERWRAILSALTRDRPLPALTIQVVYYASVFFNCLPVGTLGGDVARVLLARRFAVPVKQLVLSVLIDRIVMVTALVVLAALTLPAIAHPLARDAWFACVVILIVGVACFLLLEPVERILGRWQRWNFVQLILYAAAELRYVGRGRGILGLLFGMLSGASAALAGYCIARSLNIDIGPVALTAVMSLMSFAVALPISAAGWGIREASLVTLLGLIGVDRSAALLLSVEFGLLTTLLSLPGGLIWIARRERPSLIRQSSI
ncbi:MAG TPA: lysylphosphatidylglycerol synthase transmembrane domain-containing protein [Steroidobacteraceae bacterium]